MADERTIGEKLQSLPKFWLYCILILATSIPLFFTIPIPNKTLSEARAFYQTVDSFPEGSTVLVASDWTNSTRGESAGEFKALLRMLMRKKVKIAVYTTADPQAPQVAKDVIVRINEERKAAGEEVYRPWVDFVSVGYFPNAEGAANGIQNDVRAFFADKKDFTPEGRLTSVLQSPVLANIKSVSDFPAVVIVTGSKTSNITIERITKTPILLMVTGVMGPESLVYYASGQVKGLVSGLKGVYDVETLMQTQWPNSKNLDNGALYLPALHLAILLLIVMVVIGNVGMFMSRKRTK
jgi:hypothetical protein